MIDIPEERILKEITDILMNDLPKVLLELEEQSEDSIRLPPFRYVGLEENLPPGTSLPYAFVRIEDGIYTTKDRILQKLIFNVTIEVLLNNKGLFYKYYHASHTCIQVNIEDWMITLFRKDYNRHSLEISLSI